MSLLQYTSKEMFSSTDLIRKSKMVFDKINNKEIEKAIILRDGKPSFMLMDFTKYEELITEYLELKELVDINDNKKKKTTNEKLTQDVSHETKDEIDNKDLEKALAEIEKLDFNTSEKIQLSNEEKKEQLKDFWE
ncbi:hypothetical protein GCM10012288_14220 [Malaciobacter pacificus]|uniref:Uncharacterized protein n=1 Tax=Malaciobacter pacificus TaxID=1080223 RepID=A0A5C2HAC1_9BACT|nr:hypothetical protein [Malaciobacter pacificus]QEP33242.1 hypothetical protein APAC_0071 [Malaciobacter pacificus]GGD41271.1 hypothetical protein GCM10012288_14220 [Malaciobacter pacificus]